MRAECQVDQRLLERRSTRGAAPYLTPPTPQGNDLTCMKRYSSWSDRFSVNLSGWPGEEIVSIELLFRWDLSNFVAAIMTIPLHSLLACNAYICGSSFAPGVK